MVIFVVIFVVHVFGRCNVPKQLEMSVMIKKLEDTYRDCIMVRWENTANTKCQSNRFTCS